MPREAHLISLKSKEDPTREADNQKSIDHHRPSKSLFWIGGKFGALFFQGASAWESAKTSTVLVPVQHLSSTSDFLSRKRLMIAFRLLQHDQVSSDHFVGCQQVCWDADGLKHVCQIFELRLISVIRFGGF